MLVLPDLFLRGAASVPAALTSLRFASPRLLRGGWRGTVARGVGREDLTLVDEASVIDAALRRTQGSGAPGRDPAVADSVVDAWIATPVHLMAGLKTIHFPANGVLQLEPSEAEELASAFAKTFGVDGLELCPAGRDGFVLRGFSAPGSETVEPARLVGDSLESHLPSGAYSAELRALSSEIEMWLHGLSLNRRRETQGLPPISTLWLWGGGQPPRDPLRVIDTTPRWSRMVTNDGWARALAALAKVPVSDLPSSVDGLLASDDDALLVIASLPNDLEAFDRDFIAPAARALVAGRLTSFAIAANDRWASVTATDRYRFWRPARTAIAAIADGGA